MPFVRGRLQLQILQQSRSVARGGSLYNGTGMDRRDERRQGTARVVGLHADDGSFDREFWRGIPPKERLELVWAMTLEARHWRGERGGQPRLQRSVCRVERRGR